MHILYMWGGIMGGVVGMIVGAIIKKGKGAIIGAIGYVLFYKASFPNF